MSAATPARRLPRPDTGRWSTTTCRAAIAAAVRWGPLVEGDLHDRGRLADAMRSHGVGAVMHFAAFAYVGKSVTDPEIYYTNNVGGTLALLAAMRDAAVRTLVFSSTCAVYGAPDTVPIRETTAEAPLNPYGETKLAIERALHWYAGAYGLKYAALRYFNAAGADPDGEIGEDHEPETHLIPLVLRAALGRRQAGRDLRHRLPDPGRHRDPRLHPCDGPGRRACPGAGRSRRRRRQRRAQSRHRPGPFGARGGRRGRAGQRPPGAAARRGAPAGRSAGARRRPGPRQCRGSAGGRRTPISTRSCAPPLPGRPAAATAGAAADSDGGADALVCRLLCLGSEMTIISLAARRTATIQTCRRAD